jgi:hypothetical protein
MKARYWIPIALALVGGQARAGQPISIDQIAPSVSQLGPGWTTNLSNRWSGFTTNRIVVLVDLSSPTNEICNESKGWLGAAHRVVGRQGCEAYIVLRYAYESTGFLVWMRRYKTKENIGDDWGRDKETKVTLEPLPKVGDEVRFYQRGGMHNNLAFRRGNYLIDVEGPCTEIEKLKQLAEALDSNLVKAQKSK